MPNQDNNQKNNNNNTNQPQPLPGSDPLPPVFMTEEVHPPADINNPSPANTMPNNQQQDPIDTATKTKSQDKEEKNGTAAPIDDIQQSAVITSSSNDEKTKKTGGKGKIIATILGLLLLVGGVGAGVVLVQQQQDIRESAYIPEEGPYIPPSDPVPPPSEPEPPDDDGGGGSNGQSAQEECVEGCGNSIPCIENCLGTDYYTPPDDNSGTGGGIGPGESCSGDSDCPTDYSCLDSDGDGSYECVSSSVPGQGEGCTSNNECNNGYLCLDSDGDGSYECVANTETSSCGRSNDPGAPVCCTTECPSGNYTCENPNQRLECVTNGVYCTIEVNSPECGAGENGNGSTPSQPPTVTQTATCYDIKAFDENWTELTSSQLALLEEGDIVRFTVTGQASDGTFTKARFSINGVQRSEVTTKRPGTNAFYDEYTIPEGVSSFSILAEVYHDSLGWK